jgi:hypothetical protein
MPAGLDGLPENQRCRSSRQQGNKPPPLIPPEKKGRSRNPAPSFEKGQGGHPLVFRGRGAPVAVCASLRRSDLPAPRFGPFDPPGRIDGAVSFAGYGLPQDLLNLRSRFHPRLFRRAIFRSIACFSATNRRCRPWGSIRSHSPVLSSGDPRCHGEGGGGGPPPFPWSPDRRS